MLVAKLVEHAILPTRKNLTDAGFDLFSLENYIIKPNSFQICRTGITVEIPYNHFGLIKPKGKNNHLVGAGIIDRGYQGEILVKIVNYFNRSINIKRGDPIAQLVLILATITKIDEASLDDIHKTKTARGSSGGIVTQMIVDKAQPLDIPIKYMDDEYMSSISSIKDVNEEGLYKAIEDYTPSMEEIPSFWEVEKELLEARKKRILGDE